MYTQRLEQGALLNGRYSIQEVVGRGGMGTVYKALDTRLDIVVAVKEMTEKDVTSDERSTAIRQFEREAKMLGQLQHLNLPRVTDYFVEEDHWYLIMEFVVGETLEAMLREADGSPLPLHSVLDWAVQIADVLAYLHGQNPPIVFRDVKPANIMIQADGTVKLIDFGIARRFTAGATKDTLLYGSPGYSPPEQYGRAQTDPRSDIYALGATLHHLITGRDPAPTPFKFPPIRTFDPFLPPMLEGFVSRCIEMDEEKRIQTAEEARDTLVHVRTASLLAQRAPQPRPSGAAKSPGTGAAAGAPARKTAAPRVVSHRVQHAQDLVLVRRIAFAVVGLGLVAAIGAMAYKNFPHRAPGKPAPEKTALAEPPPSVLTPLQTNRTETTGSIHLTTTPPAIAVFVDGKESGKTPLDVTNLPPGRHTFRFVPPEGSGLVEATRDVEIAAGTNRGLDTALLSTAPPGGDQPAILFPHITALAVNGPTADRSGVRISVGMRVTGAAGKTGTLGVYFYGPDGSAIQPARAAANLQTRDGQFAVFSQFKPDADSEDYPDMTVFVPQNAFPIPYDKVLYRVEVFLDDKLINQTDMLALSAK